MFLPEERSVKCRRINYTSSDDWSIDARLMQQPAVQSMPAVPGSDSGIDIVGGGDPGLRTDGVGAIAVGAPTLLTAQDENTPGNDNRLPFQVHHAVKSNGSATKSSQKWSTDHSGAGVSRMKTEARSSSSTWNRNSFSRVHSASRHNYVGPRQNNVVLGHGGAQAFPTTAPGLFRRRFPARSRDGPRAP